MTLGQDAVRVVSQSAEGVPENVRYRRYGLSFAALHVVGSNDDLAPWNGTDPTVTAPTPRQVREQAARMGAGIQQMRDTFATATRRGDRAVVLLMQADMFDESYGGPSVADPADYSAFSPLVQAIVDEASAFDGPVYLFNGDSHEYRADAPLAAGSPWLDFYEVDGSADNLARVVVVGSGEAGEGYLEVAVAPRRERSEVLTWEQVPYGTTD